MCFVKFLHSKCRLLILSLHCYIMIIRKTEIINLNNCMLLFLNSSQIFFPEHKISIYTFRTLQSIFSFQCLGKNCSFESSVIPTLIIFCNKYLLRRKVRRIFPWCSCISRSIRIRDNTVLVSLGVYGLEIILFLYLQLYTD